MHGGSGRRGGGFAALPARDRSKHEEQAWRTRPPQICSGIVIIGCGTLLFAPAALVEDQPGPVAVLDCGGVDENPHRQPFTPDQGVDLAALDPLADVVTHFVVVPAPFSADLIDWLSRTAAEGLASCPICSRKRYMQFSSDRLPDAITPKLAEDVVDR
jgi:hypothetical protein